jgi:hypothetical protein
VRSFVLLYNGPTTSPGASHEGWPDWFQSIGDKLVDIRLADSDAGGAGRLLQNHFFC